MEEEKETKGMYNEAKKLSKLFEIEFTLRIFGKVLIHWVYPPQNTEFEYVRNRK